jgi:DNA/RNA-binding domain of Phe-tRNA-synthetase-like protein
MQVSNTLLDNGLLAGIVLAHGIQIRPSSAELATQLSALVSQRKQQEFPPPAVKEAVRNLLKSGGFKPSGRNKPASEYLAQAAREDRFPVINNLVDINNLISLRSGLPISLLDADAVGETLTLRYGRVDERYVFNAAGQQIDLEGLICACNGTSDQPLGNPVKDSVAGKLTEATQNVVGIIYCPRNPQMNAVAEQEAAEFARWLQTEGAATFVDVLIR